MDGDREAPGLGDPGQKRGRLRWAGLCGNSSPPITAYVLDSPTLCSLRPPPRSALSPPSTSRPARLPLVQPSRRCRRAASRRVVSVPPSASSLSVALAIPSAVPPSLHSRVPGGITLPWNARAARRRWKEARARPLVLPSRRIEETERERPFTLFFPLLLFLSLLSRSRRFPFRRFT